MLRSAVLLACSCVALGSCVRRPDPVEGGGGGPIGDQPPPPSGDPLADTLAVRDRELATRGYQVMGSPVRGELAAGALTAYPVAAQSGLCYVTFVITADPALDVDLFVYDSDGVEVARHLAPAAASGAFVGFCPPRAGRHSVHVHAYAGAGPYVYAAYQGNAPPEGLQSVFAAAPSAAGPGAGAPVDPAVAGRVAARDQGLGREGYTRAGAPSTTALRRGEVRAVSAQLDNGRCYAFVVLSGADDEDVDLTLFSPGGQRLERDDRTASNASVRHCPLVAGTYNLEVKLADGQGAVWLLAYVRGAAPAASIASFDALAGPGPVAVPAATDAARRIVDHDLRSRGYVPAPAPAATGTLAEGASASHELALEGGRCYALSAAADLPMTGIELAVFDRNAEMARDAAGRAWAVTRVCPLRAVRVRAEARATAGAGTYQLGTWSWPLSTQGPFGLQGAIFVRLSEATSLLGHDGFEPTTTPTVVEARAGTPQRADVDLPAGSCYAIVAAGGPEAREVELSLLAGQTVLTTAQPREPVAIVRRCVEAQARHRLELRVTRGAGQVLHQVFGEAQAAPPEGAAAPAPAP